MAQDVFALAYDAARDGTDLSQIPRGRALVVCRRDPQPANSRLWAKCSSFKQRAPVAASSIQVLPIEVRQSLGRTWIMPDTTSVELSSYDLDATR